MKIILAVLGVIILAVIILGFLFVQWANQPEQVAALQQKRQQEAAQNIEDEKRKPRSKKK